MPQTTGSCSVRTRPYNDHVNKSTMTHCVSSKECRHSKKDKGDGHNRDKEDRDQKIMVNTQICLGLKVERSLSGGTYYAGEVA